MAEMSETPSSRDKYLEALDFITNVLKEHEQILDKSIHELALVTEKIGNTDQLNGKVEKVDEKISLLQKKLTNLTDYLLNSPKEALPSETKKLEPSVQMSPAVYQGEVQGGVSVALHCKQWTDFQALAMNAQTLTFSFKEAEKLFQADALKGNQLITYIGSLPDLSTLLRTWLSVQLDRPEQNILEWSLGKPK
jgi:uncharacterized coiled-coil protein SlyX